MNIPVVKYNFISLKDLESIPKDTTCGDYTMRMFYLFQLAERTFFFSFFLCIDVIAIAKETHDLSEITAKSTGKTVRCGYFYAQVNIPLMNWNTKQNKLLDSQTRIDIGR